MLDDPVLSYANQHCSSVSPTSERSYALDLMRALGLSQIPIVDQQKRLIGVHLLRDILGSIERPNWAVIMAGGRGERLRPLTDTIPKPMIKVAGRPILERLVLHYVGHGVRTIFVAVNYMSYVIQEYFGDGTQFGCEIHYLEESRPLGTAGAISLLPTLPQHPLLVTNGDLITDFDVGAILSLHEQQGHAITVGVREYRHTVPFGVMEMEGGTVRSVREKPSLVCLANAGVYVLQPRLVTRIEKDKEFTMPELIEDCLLRNELVGGYAIDGEWLDVGRPADLRIAVGAVVKE
jgi:NDP-sugar pyrophosphorylase family protein